MAGAGLGLRRKEIMASEAAVMEALRGVMDPELHRDIVTLGMAENVR